MTRASASFCSSVTSFFLFGRFTFLFGGVVSAGFRFNKIRVKPSFHRHQLFPTFLAGFVIEVAAVLHRFSFENTPSEVSIGIRHSRFAPCRLESQSSLYRRRIFCNRNILTAYCSRWKLHLDKVLFIV